MTNISKREYFRGKWPEEKVPGGEPLWLMYEIDRVADNVLRTVEIFPDGSIARNSIVLEERNGDSCASLIDGSLETLLSHAMLEEITSEQFEDLWTRGENSPHWFV